MTPPSYDKIAADATQSRFNSQLTLGATSGVILTWSIRYKLTSTKPRPLIVADLTPIACSCGKSFTYFSLVRDAAVAIL